jgi:hypothetical protein
MRKGIVACLPYTGPIYDSPAPRFEDSGQWSILIKRAFFVVSEREAGNIYNYA